MINQPKMMYFIYLKQNSVCILRSTLLLLSLSIMMEGCFEGSKSQCSLLQQSGCNSQQFCALDFAGQEQCVPKKDTFTALGSPCTLFDECGPQHGCFKHFGVSLCLPFCDLNQSQQTCPTLNTEQATWSQFGECILSIDDFNSVGLCTYPCQPGSTQDGYASCSWEESPSQCRFVPNLSFSVCTSSLSELGLDSTQNRQQTRTRLPHQQVSRAEHPKAHPRRSTNTASNDTASNTSKSSAELVARLNEAQAAC